MLRDWPPSRLAQMAVTSYKATINMKCEGKISYPIIRPVRRLKFLQVRTSEVQRIALVILVIIPPFEQELIDILCHPVLRRQSKLESGDQSSTGTAREKDLQQDYEYILGG